MARRKGSCDCENGFYVREHGGDILQHNKYPSYAHAEHAAIRFHQEDPRMSLEVVYVETGRVFRLEQVE